MVAKMKKRDLLIISHLRKNGRISLTNLSKATNIPISTIFDRLKVHEDCIIQKHTSLINFEKLGFNTRANVCLKVDKDKRDEVQNHLLKHPNINSLFKINNGYDFMVEAIFKNIKDLGNFLEDLDEKFDVKEKQVYYVIEDLKREEFMADTDMLDLVNAHI